MLQTAGAQQPWGVWSNLFYDSEENVPMVVGWGIHYSITLYLLEISSTQRESHRNLLGAFIVSFCFPQKICSASGVKAVKPDFSSG